MFNDAFRAKKVLVTGNTGFKGSWMTMWLHELGAEVVGLSDGIPTQPSHFEAAGLQELVPTRWLDIRNTEDVAATIAAESPDFVFHLAAQALVKASYDDPVGTHTTNAIGTANVLEGLRWLNKPCTAIMVTSDKCYENVETYYGYRETDPLGGVDPYSASKAAAEIIISSYVRAFFNDAGEPNVRIASTRAGNVIGGGDWAADRLVPDVARAWSNGERVTIRRPQATRPWQHVLEPLSGYLHLAEQLSRRPGLHGEAFNFGPNALAIHPVRDVVTVLNRHLDGLDLVIDESQAHFHEAGLLKLTCDKALDALSWTPVLDFEETMQMCAEWFAAYYGNESANIHDLTSRQLHDYVELAADRGQGWAA